MAAREVLTDKRIDAIHKKSLDTSKYTVYYSNAVIAFVALAIVTAGFVFVGLDALYSASNSTIVINNSYIVNVNMGAILSFGAAVVCGVLCAAFAFTILNTDSHIVYVSDEEIKESAELM